MNIAANINSYYTTAFTSSSSDGRSRPVTSVSVSQELLRSKDELLPAMTPGDLVRTKPKKVERIVYELDGKEINPVDILFEKPPPSREDKFKNYLKLQKEKTGAKLQQFKELNDKIAAERTAGFNEDFKSTIKTLHVRKIRKHVTKPRDPNAFDPFPSETADTESQREVSVSSISTAEPPIAAATPIAAFSNAVWGAINAVWVPKPEAVSREPISPRDKPEIVVTKCYKRDKKNNLVLVAVRKDSIVSQRAVSASLQTPLQASWWGTIRSYLRM